MERPNLMLKLGLKKQRYFSMMTWPCQGALGQHFNHRRQSEHSLSLFLLLKKKKPGGNSSEQENANTHTQRVVLLTCVARLWVHRNHHFASCSPPGSQGALQSGDAAGRLVTISSWNITAFKYQNRDSNMFYPYLGKYITIISAYCFHWEKLFIFFSWWIQTLYS